MKKNICLVGISTAHHFDLWPNFLEKVIHIFTKNISQCQRYLLIWSKLRLTEKDVHMYVTFPATNWILSQHF